MDKKVLIGIGLVLIVLLFGCVQLFNRGDCKTPTDCTKLAISNNDPEVCENLDWMSRSQVIFCRFAVENSRSCLEDCNYTSEQMYGQTCADLVEGCATTFGGADSYCQGFRDIDLCNSNEKCAWTGDKCLGK